MLINRIKIKLLIPFLALLMVLVPVVTGIGSDIPEKARSNLLGILNRQYAKLPGVEYQFGKPTASFENVTIAANTSLAISEANLSEGLLIGLARYGEQGYLILATALPENMEKAYAVGLIDLSKEKTVYVDYAELEERDQVGGGISLNISSEEGAKELRLEVSGKKYVLRVSLPKSF